MKLLKLHCLDWKEALDDIIDVLLSVGVCHCLLHRKVVDGNEHYRCITGHG
jgi:hypothetical protein